MVQIKDKSKCCGCEACVQICPQQCIKLRIDHEGFAYPEADANLCIDCGLCETACPELHPSEAKRPMETFAAINKDDEIRMNSSSGGIFTFLADQVIEAGGVVFGVRFNDNWMPVFDYAETKKDVAPFRGSKYIQAQVGDAYIRCREFLESKRLVLFSGTPCQIAGLNHFLGKTYPNLLAVDFVCHGVPSPKVWSNFLNENTETPRSSIQSIRFRDKQLGWKKYSLNIDYVSEGKMRKITKPFYSVLFIQAFLNNLILRPSCHCCSAKSGKSNSDITIGDLWGVENIIPQMDDNKGTSLVLSYSTKGCKYLKSNMIAISHIGYDVALHYNSAIESSFSAHPHREQFFANIDKIGDIHQLIVHSFRPSLIIRFRRSIKTILKYLFKK